MRRRTFTFTAPLTAGLLASCTGPPQMPNDETAGTSANLYLYQEPVAFNPLRTPAGAEQLTMSLVFDNLFMAGPDFSYVPRLAESWDISEDATTFTFHLVQNAVWSDGEPFTAEDVVFSYNLFAHPDVGSGWATRLAEVEGYQEFVDGEADSFSGITALDEHTVEFTLATPNAGFLSLIGYSAVFFIMPQHVLGEEDPAEMLEHEFFDLPTVGMGPYVMDAFNVDQDVILTANDNYRSDVGIGTLYLKILTSDVATAQLGTGEIDLVQISPLDLEAVQAFDTVQIEEVPSAGFNRMAVNQTKPQFEDPRVRQAILTAIDRDGIIEGVLGGYASTLNSGIMTPWALPDDLDDFPHDPERAKSLLEKSGWDASQEVRISWVPGQRDRDQMVNVVVDNLLDVGISAVADQVDEGALTDMFTDQSYDLVLFGGGVYTPDPASTFPIISCDQFFPAGANNSYFCNPELDELMQRGGETSDQDERASIYQKAARLDNELVPYIWLNVPDTIWAVSDRLQGFAPHGDYGNGFWNAHEWTISE